MSLHSIVNIDSATRVGLTCREGAGVRPLRAHSETPWGASIEQKLAALKLTQFNRLELLNHMFIDHVDGAFFCLENVLKSILRLGRSARESNNNDRGIMIDHLSITEGSKIGALPIG
jgi:hypothetical protein